MRKGRMFKGLEIEREQRVQLNFVGVMGMGQAVSNGVFEGIEISMVNGIEALLFDEFPEPLNEVQVG